MLASMVRVLIAATACAVFAPHSVMAADPAPAKPAAKKPAASSSTTTTPKKKKKPATAAKKPAPAPPPPPPAVELIGYVTMPAGAFRCGPPSGQFDNEGRRAAAPRFDSQPVQGVSSIK
ncbi:MAG TPA: hypothetical protein VFO82_10755, partial [Steroidobacteraceae bacterium]|nr:hypothetical protein [Steroidobacteraceae bacterium]